MDPVELDELRDAARPGMAAHYRAALTPQLLSRVGLGAEDRDRLADTIARCAVLTPGALQDATAWTDLVAFAVDHVHKQRREERAAKERAAQHEKFLAKLQRRFDRRARIDRAPHLRPVPRRPREPQSPPSARISSPPDDPEPPPGGWLCAVCGKRTPDDGVSLVLRRPGQPDQPMHDECGAALAAGIVTAMKNRPKA